MARNTPIGVASGSFFFLPLAALASFALQYTVTLRKPVQRGSEHEVRAGYPQPVEKGEAICLRILAYLINNDKQC